MIYKQNRELSWLKFNERVLQEATDDTVPLLERLRYLTIFTTNLDEFFQVRVGSLLDLQAFKKDYRDNKSGMTAKEQLHAIYAAVRPLYEERERVYFDLERQLRKHNISRLTFGELKGEEQEYAERYFQESILPVLSPVVIDSHHPFPHLQNKLIYIMASLRNRDDKPIHALLPIPAALPDVLYLQGDGVRYIAIEDLVYEMAETVFDTYEMDEKVQICITRNADIHAEDEDFDVENDFREVMKHMLSERKRLAPLRLEFSKEPSEALIAGLKERLGLTDRQIFVTSAPLRLNYAYPLEDKLDSELRKILVFRPFSPQPSASVDPRRPMVDQLNERDLVLSYPFESMEPFIRMVDEAADDPAVISVQITIYRLAGRSELVDGLCRAAQNGKDVTVLIELRARFDEQNNIDWSKRLERAGCTVIYGIPNYKVHSKVCLVTYRDHGEIRFITQVGTGNYNEKTSKLYTDLSFITANQEIGRDAAVFFRNMGIGNLYGQYTSLLVAPVSFKQRVMELLDREIAKGERGRVFLKLNSMTDKEIINKLAEASAAGVRVQMIVRGICCLLPGIPGVTENIEVRSIVGRYLEHSRIYSFGSDDDEELFISSGDFMTRNTERRVEVACPINDPQARQRIHDICDLLWKDTRKARRLRSDGTFERIAGAQLDSQLEQMNAAMHAWEESPFHHGGGNDGVKPRVMRAAAAKGRSESAPRNGFLRRILGR